LREIDLKGLPACEETLGSVIVRDLVVNSIAAQPALVKRWLLNHPRLLLGVLFRLERNEVVVSPAGPRKLRFRMKMSWQSHTTYALGAYEEEFIDVLRQHVHPGDTCIDVGGHLGYYCMIMSRLVGPKGRVITFEPVPENKAALFGNVSLNRLTNVEVVGVALGAHDGEISLVCPESETLSFHPSAAAYDVKGKQCTISVRSETLDSFLGRKKYRPSVIKIDVEGAELDVLRGAAETLRKIRPTILLEIHGWGDPESKEIMTLLSSVGYKATLVGLRGREAHFLGVPDGSAA
jgi:FkbM family methyltransferase